MRTRILIALVPLALLAGCTAVQDGGAERPVLGLSTQWLTEEPFQADTGAQLRVTARNNASSPLNATVRFHYPDQAIADHVTITHDSATTDRIELGTLGPGDARGEAVNVTVRAHAKNPTFPVNVSLYAGAMLIDSTVLEPTFMTDY